MFGLHCPRQFGWLLRHAYEEELTHWAFGYCYIVTRCRRCGKFAFRTV